MDLYQATLSKPLVNEPNNVLLFKNSSFLNQVVRFQECLIQQAITKESTWEVRLNPTITSNGTQVSVINLSGTIPNTSTVYLSPILSSTGLLLRKFTINPTFDYFKLTIPDLYLNPNNSILLRSVSTDTDAYTTATIEIRWNEIF